MILEEHILSGISHRAIEPLFDRQRRQGGRQAFCFYRQFPELVDYLASSLNLIEDIFNGFRMANYFS